MRLAAGEIFDMQLTDEQKSKVAQWIADGMKLSEIQSRLGSELEIRLTYMEARMLVDDLKLLPKDPAPEQKPVPADAPAAPPETAAGDLAPEAGAPAPAPTGGVTVAVDTLMRPGAMVSGSVTFSDGQKAAWYLDNMGQLGMVPPFPGYKPAPTDIPQFQMLLDKELTRMGL